MCNKIQKYFKIEAYFFDNEDMDWKSYLIFEKISVLFDNFRFQIVLNKSEQSLEYNWMPEISTAQNLRRADT